MRVRIEPIEDDRPEEVVVYCRKLTPEVEALIQELKQEGQDKIGPSFFKGDQQYFLSLREILFFETQEDRVFAQTRDDAYEVRERLYALESILPGYFVRVSRSCIVNILHVFSIQKSLTRVTLISFRHSHKEVYGSRHYSHELFRKMNERYLYENT
jgi:DNA-binding LytR/AlgR family response regulator